MSSYILFISVFIFSLILTVVIESKLIPYLKNRAKQPIYEGGPSWHLSKSGTPTMGGLAFLVAIFISLLATSLLLIYTDKSKTEGISILITLLFATGNSMIGIFDDVTKLKRKQNAGLTPMQKIGLQTILAVIFLMAREHFFADGTKINIGIIEINLGVFYYLFAIVLLLGVVNCANLTDGIDGLASCVGVAIGITFFVIGHKDLLSVPLLSVALVGGALGFLFFNSHPAKIFMGDTGSLFLGALTVGIAFSLRKPMLIIPIGVVYVIEGISVILQVIVYKLTKKRLFKMAPIHHHFELCGWSETKVVAVFSIVTAILCLIALMGV
jgi:phospho-N-acetylmuramoyl-pentapeptide-transferase